MKVLIIGSGGREHALAWKVAQSPRLTELFVAPGNAGTSPFNHPWLITPNKEVVSAARQHGVELALIGPEAPLAAGLADDLRQAGFKVFGPSRSAAEIEYSKAFAKSFMARHNIPTARFETFGNFDAALAHTRSVAYPIVIKASGLAAGKGVMLPESPQAAESALRGIMLEREFGDAGNEVVIEERLDGEEVSLLAFSDGVRAIPMPPAQDHKRLLDGDCGPNTGGMGAYAPAPICPASLVAQIMQRIIQPAIDGLRAEGRVFVGVLYAGLMLTSQGPRVLEFNCRFGDPETQVLLPLLDSDLLDIAEACADGRMADVEVKWKSGAAACVVLASDGYPGSYPKGRVIAGLDHEPEDAIVFHAGTGIEDGKVITAGGRVLSVTGWGETIENALQRAYAAVERVRFEGMQYRRDIGWRAFQAVSPAAIHFSVTSPFQTDARSSSAPIRLSVSSPLYAYSGVNIDAGNRAVALMRDAVQSTYGPEVLAGFGAFGGLFSAAALKAMGDPVLVASTDGVGTKVKLAALAGCYESIGHDIVNHCVNDILVQGARPLFFLDYVASSKLDPELIASIVHGIAAACKEAGCALLGGETAEMPGVYQPDEFDLAGTIVGVVERADILPRDNLKAGDILIGLRSSGPHTNGYSLIRRIFADTPLETVFPELGIPLADALLAPHRSYLPLVLPLVTRHPSSIKALAHLTGGGFVENIPRVLPDHLTARISLGSWPVPPIYRIVQQHGDVATDEMYRVFNMGIGMIAVVAPEDTAAFQSAIPEETFVIGELVLGQKQVILK